MASCKNGLHQGHSLFQKCRLITTMSYPAHFPFAKSVIYLMKSWGMLPVCGLSNVCGLLTVIYLEANISQNNFTINCCAGQKRINPQGWLRFYFSSPLQPEKRLSASDKTKKKLVHFKMHRSVDSLGKNMLSKICWFGAILPKLD